MEHVAQISIIITNLVVTGGLLIWLTKRHAEKIDKLLIEMSKVKTKLDQIKGDHEKVIKLEHEISKTNYDLNVAFNNIREIKKEL